MTTNEISNGRSSSAHSSEHKKVVNEDENLLNTNSLQVWGKRFYFDLKKNKRGYLLKIAQVGVDQKKNRILFFLQTVTTFLQKLEYIVNEANNIAKDAEVPENRRFLTEVIASNIRLYYIDLMHGERGRYIKISQTIRGSQNRSTITVPLSFISKFTTSIIRTIKIEGHPELDEVLVNVNQQEHSEHEVYEESRKSKAKNSPRKKVERKHKSNKVCSETLRWDKRTYHISVMQDARGRFIRVSFPQNQQYLTLPITCVTELGESLDRLFTKQEAIEFDTIANSVTSSLAHSGDESNGVPNDVVVNDSAIDNASIEPGLDKMEFLNMNGQGHGINNAVQN